MSKKPLVSVLIINYNGLSDTLHCLSSIKKTAYPNYEVIILDNGSIKNEAKELKKYAFKNIHVYRSKINKGFAGGNNTALKKAQGKYIVLLNNDTEVDPEWLTPLVLELEKDKTIAVAQPKIRLFHNRAYFDYAGACGGFIDKHGYPFTRGRIFNAREKDKGQYDQRMEIFWASGAACIIRKSIIKDVGGLFDEMFFNYMEEIDFCWRVQKKGFKIIFIPNSLVYHKGASSSSKNLFKKRYWEHRNNLLLLSKHLDSNALIKLLPFRLLMELFTYGYYLLSGQFNYVRSILFAHIDFLKGYSKTHASSSASGEQSFLYNKSIVIDYFLRKKSTFHELKWSPKRNISYFVLNTKDSGGLKVIVKHLNAFTELGYQGKLYSLYGKRPSNLDDRVEFKHILFSLIDKNTDIAVATFWPSAYWLSIIPSRKKFYFIQGLEHTFYKNNLLSYLVKRTYLLPLTKIAISNLLKNNLEQLPISGSVQTIKYSVLNTIYLENTKAKTLNNHKKIRIIAVISYYIHPKGPDILESTIIELKKHFNLEVTLISKEKNSYSDVFDRFYSDPPIDIIQKLYQKADICLATSRTEGFFIPGLEAMASGCLFITTDSLGIHEYAQNNRNSIILGNITDLWEKNLLGNLLKDRAKTEKIITNGYLTAKQFSSENIINELQGIYFN